MLSSRAKWFVVIGIAIVLGALGVGGYYYISGKAKIGASTESNDLISYWAGMSWVENSFYWLLNPTRSSSGDIYISAGVSDQKALILLKAGDGNTIEEVKFYPIIKSATCNVIGATACFERGTTPIASTTNISSEEQGAQIISVSMPNYDSITAATFKEIYGARGYSLPYAPDQGGAYTKAVQVYVVNSNGDEVQVQPTVSGNIGIVKPPVAATQSIEKEAGESVRFCDSSVNWQGSTISCDAYIDLSSIGYQSLGALPSSEWSYINGAFGGYTSEVTAHTATVNTYMAGTYRIMNTDYNVVVNGDNVVGDEDPQITTFSANPTEIASGESSTLTWITKNVNNCTLNGEVVDVSGSSTVSPTETTAYALACTNSSTSETVNATISILVSSTGGGDPIISCASDETAYSFTPNAWNLKTNNFTPKGSSTKLSDYFNSFLGTLVVNTYGYSGTGTSYTQNPNLSSVPAGVGYWFTSGVQNPICISADNASTSSVVTVTIPSSIAMVGNPTTTAKKLSDIKFTHNGETMSLIDASNKSTPLVKAIFTYTAGADSYDAYYAKAYSNYVGDGAQFIENAMSKTINPGSGFWIITNSKITGSTLTF